jgi:hypothetical protein
MYILLQGQSLREIVHIKICHYTAAIFERFRVYFAEKTSSVLGNGQMGPEG